MRSPARPQGRALWQAVPLAWTRRWKLNARPHCHRQLHVTAPARARCRHWRRSPESRAERSTCPSFKPWHRPWTTGRIRPMTISKSGGGHRDQRGCRTPIAQPQRSRRMQPRCTTRRLHRRSTPPVKTGWRASTNRWTALRRLWRETPVKPATELRGSYNVSLLCTVFVCKFRTARQQKSPALPG
jgi:hypothetical protein